jgi:hypothetical protein
MKIAVFLYFFPGIERIYISSFYKMLINMGHKVDVFCFFSHDPISFGQASLIEKNLRIFCFDGTSFSYDRSNKVKKVLRKILNKIRNYLNRFFPKINYKHELNKNMLYIKNVFQKTREFDCSIGIEKGGIICAHHLYKLFKIPFYYYSLELYDENHSEVKNLSMFTIMRQKEIIAHRKAIGTIIQDEGRKIFLYKTGNINKNKPYFLMPVSFIDDSITNYLSNHRYNNPIEKKILNFGLCRLPDDFFIALIKRLPCEYTFLMHNYDTTYHEKLSNKYNLKNVCFSNIVRDEKEITALISQSFICFSWYQNECANDQLIAFSSEKTARYLAAGKPIIANAKTNFTELFSSVRCGIAVNTPEEFIDALHEISLNYREFSQKAREAFDLYYKLENYQQSLNIFLQDNLK